jgi:hypothetical protein
MLQPMNFGTPGQPTQTNPTLQELDEWKSTENPHFGGKNHGFL